MLSNVLFLMSFFRRLVSLYNLAYQQGRRRAQKTNGLTWPHLWLVCDGKDKSHTAFLSASFYSVKESCTQSSLVSSKYSNGGIRPDEKELAEDDQYTAAGYVVTIRGSIYFINPFFV